MRFLSDAAFTTFHTVASDCGVGGYSFYTVDDIEKPVAFISSSLTASQLWWFIVQKEAFGIFYFRKIL